MFLVFIVLANNIIAALYVKLDSVRCEVDDKRVPHLVFYYWIWVAGMFNGFCSSSMDFVLHHFTSTMIC